MAASERGALGTLDIQREWKAARQTKAVGAVLRTLQQMMGVHERCMYCVDSHGSDIEHFRPKARYPGRAFEWSNMLLCCTECGRFKGSQFPMANRRPMLIDPTAEDPWQHLDFDPDTGNLTARFDLHVGDWSVRGAKTVEILRLNRREAMSAGYLKTYRRLTRIVQTSLALLADGAPEAPELLAALRDADDHGLLPWCFDGAGQTFAPFSELCHQYPQVWADCLAAVRRIGDPQHDQETTT
ncbi:MAG: TIGR02646 family protein [Sterolibacteriaceae bacterium]|uniref:TIGR02646 family protein n=1 Tax=Candidatus Methylophosphatis roskildensis TaxID=2899263 RepID=A0A9D7HL13_9PROT|nr:TIGR02646 family protein [Candidatus Methylophosphatis roskildensis]MBK7238428.1 TIGR02646 family protein [Sterolibacteriaceae bacterium]